MRLGGTKLALRHRRSMLPRPLAASPAARAGRCARSLAALAHVAEDRRRRAPRGRRPRRRRLARRAARRHARLRLRLRGMSGEKRVGTHRAREALPVTRMEVEEIFFQ